MISILCLIEQEFQLPEREEQQKMINDFMKDLYNSLKKDAEKRGEDFPKFRKPPKQLFIDQASKKPIEI